ncbi:MAG: formylglycine-generating enzyme family protein [Candidatus Scalindua sp.]|jgi:formylglycine-generating enzyme required for sulfatase activity|nr:formylglycine-generating enzyme family protein [Candidatus Scalindua sp.]MBT6048931.1 formylglycine-generating enzyme family protein [Candidatus Scalindua sp.]MBT6230724.1 formylglycine-generating enzyme family protein [Candidatus Scalindua sp.]MBT7213171.1 formylglycine-generating enzyme family protein [Candidatus Scalindua sp.]MBT7591292.1 formylglycine-generating enzyme family protein [Candidatus Scalindua sp.]
MTKTDRKTYKEDSRIMQAIRIKYIRQVVICSIFTLALIMTAQVASVPVVFAKEKDLPPEIQLDLLINSATKDIEAERWEDAVQNFEKAMNLGLNLPGEFHFLYGKALFKTESYGYSLSSLTNYLTLAGQNGKYYEEAITLVVDAENKQKEKMRRTAESKQQQIKVASETEDGMIFVKGGCFDMGDIFETGDKDEKPVHTVCVGDFYLGKTEVTQKQWEGIIGNNPSKFQCGECPVERVSWNNVQDFIKKLNEKTGRNYRLPTEAEWEYAARSGGWKEQWAGTNDKDKIEEYTWYGFTAEGRTHAVAQKTPNGIGLYDMMGNVWEWCSDWYDKKYYETSPSKDPQGPSDGKNRVLRGGGWRSKDKGLRTTDRNYFVPTSKKFSDIGFRLARDL